jgi:nitronate monooxygenase
MARLSTKFTKLFSCRVPILGAPMANVSGAELASSICEGGGLGFIAAGHLTDVNELYKQADIFRKLSPQAPLSIGFILHSSARGGLDRISKVLDDIRPEVVQFSMPGIVEQGKNVALAREKGAKVVIQVGSEIEAMEAIKTNPDCIIAQGRESGGHGLRSELATGTLPFTCRVLKLVKEYSAEESNKPCVLAAGGIVDGRGLAAMIALGCDGVVFGTRLWATHEAMGKRIFKETLVRSSCDDTIRTQVFDQIGNSYLPVNWPYPYDSGGVIHNKTSKKWHGKYEQLAEIIKSGKEEHSLIVEEFQNAMLGEGNPEIGCVFAGEGVGCIDSIDSASNVVMKAEAEAVYLIEAMSNVITR